MELRKVLARFNEDKSKCSSEETSSQGDAEHAQLPNGTPQLPESASLYCNHSNHLNDSHSPSDAPTVSGRSPVVPSEEGSLISQLAQTHATITDSHSPNDLQMSSDFSSPFQSSLGSSVTSDSGEPISPGGRSTSVQFSSGEGEVVRFSSTQNVVSNANHSSPKLSNRTRADQETETSTVVNADTTCEETLSSECSNGDTTLGDRRNDTAVLNDMSDNHHTADNCTHTPTDPTTANPPPDRELSPLASRLSPDSYTCFKEYLNHVPEMNLPWQPLRSVWQCSCGTAFSFSTRKVGSSSCLGVSSLDPSGKVLQTYLLCFLFEVAPKAGLCMDMSGFVQGIELHMPPKSVNYVSLVPRTCGRRKSFLLPGSLGTRLKQCVLRLTPGNEAGADITIIGNSLK